MECFIVLGSFVYHPCWSFHNTLQSDLAFEPLLVGLESAPGSFSDGFHAVSLFPSPADQIWSLLGPLNSRLYGSSSPLLGGLSVPWVLGSFSAGLCMVLGVLSPPASQQFFRSPSWWARSAWSCPINEVVIAQPRTRYCIWLLGTFPLPA